MNLRPAVKAALLVGLTAVAVAGCTQKSAAGSDNPVVSSSMVDTDTGSPTAPSSTATDSATASSTPPSSRPAPTSSPVVAPTAKPTPTIERGGCPSSVLTIRALRGSGAAGHQYAFLQFTNNSTSSCTLTGYPGVQLLLGGKPLGSPAQRSGKPISTVTLAPGTSASAGIIVDSACNASISDSVQVIPPNRTDKIVLKLALRGCSAQVDPLTAS